MFDLSSDPHPTAPTPSGPAAGRPGVATAEHGRGSLVAVNASASAIGRCHRLADAAVRIAGTGRVIDLALLDAEALLGRRPDTELDEMILAVTGARQLVVVTPVRRGTYTALLKAFCEVLPRAGLEGAQVTLGGTGPAPYEFPLVDPSLRALVEGLHGEVTEECAYGTPTDFGPDGEPAGALRRALERAIAGEVLGA